MFYWHALKPTAQAKLIQEGLAVAHDLTGRDQLKRARQAMIEAGVTRVDLRACW